MNQTELIEIAKKCKLFTEITVGNTVCFDRYLQAFAQEIRNRTIDECLARLKELENSTTNDYHGIIGYCAVNIQNLKSEVTK